MVWAGKIIRFGLKAVGTGVVGLVGWLGYQHGNGNFHTVLEGEVYRSAQITPAALAEYHETYGIKSVLNLRGAKPGQDWYDAEVAEAARLGITHVDFPMSASQEMDVARQKALIALMRAMPKPLLVHCRHGSDRTGLAMALYLAGIHGSDEARAEGQLSLWYGHFAVPYLSDAYPMDQSWERMVPELGFSDS
jgi:protein tyrosine/serine phosphatase